MSFNFFKTVIFDEKDLQSRNKDRRVQIFKIKQLLEKLKAVKVKKDRENMRVKGKRRELDDIGKDIAQVRQYR